MASNSNLTRNSINKIKTISHLRYINEIIDIGISYEHEYDTILTAIQIGDYFIKTSVGVKYSLELAHVASILAAKSNEDFGYRSTLIAADELQNGIVYQLEHDILEKLDFRLVNNRLIEKMVRLTPSTELWLKHSILMGLTISLARNQKVFANVNPKTLVIAIMLLYRHNKLKLTKSVRQYKFLLLLQLVVKLTDTNWDDVINMFKLLGCQKV